MPPKRYQFHNLRVVTFAGDDKAVLHDAWSAVKGLPVVMGK